MKGAEQKEDVIIEADNKTVLFRPICKSSATRQPQPEQEHTIFHKRQASKES